MRRRKILEILEDMSSSWNGMRVRAVIFGKFSALEAVCVLRRRRHVSCLTAFDTPSRTPTQCVFTAHDGIM